MAILFALWLITLGENCFISQQLLNFDQAAMTAPILPSITNIIELVSSQKVISRRQQEKSDDKSTAPADFPLNPMTPYSAHVISTDEPALPSTHW